MLSLTARWKRLQQQIRTNGYRVLPDWVARWIYWNAGLYRFGLMQNLRQAYKYHKRVKKFGITDPILVYQMGKVGSVSVYESLRALGLDVPVYHCHLLNNLDEIEQKVRRFLPKARQTLVEINRGRQLRKKILTQKNQRWNVISLVRRPVARNVSAFFENLGELVPEYEQKYARRELGVDELARLFVERYDHDAPREWFDSQVKAFFGIDVFATEFPTARGYQIYEGAKCRLLVIRLEDLDACAAQAMREFLGIPDFQLLAMNRAEQKEYRALYREFLQRANLPQEYLKEMYSTRYARHFYSRAELAEFAKSWTRQASMVLVGLASVFRILDYLF